ncbi:NUDIX domain-containing protein [Candidatus Babeliales bacterium]|nr:NUDIX domain-containing protein [Candidatus Babeliales bacterium]MBP9844379.1 NUDIX domain-containing protein [Candidatus Babeliales bacterium]
MIQQRFQLPIFTSLIVRKNHQILLLKRNKDKVCGGFYAFPGGGVDGNEPVTTATVREAQEEIGVTIDLKDLKFVHVFHFSRKNDVEYVNFFFEVQQWQGVPENKEPEKCDEAVWFDLDHLPEKILPSHQHVLAMIKNKIEFSEYGWSE